MKIADTHLLDFFTDELAALRVDAAQFASSYPAAASALGLNRGHSNDPQVELLIQSFAFLAGRLRYQVEVGSAALPNSLMDYLYPHMSAPIPVMMIAQIDVKPDGANFSKKVPLKRGTYLTATAASNTGTPITCRFRTAYETPLCPLEITQIRMLGDQDLPRSLGSQAGSAISIIVERTCIESIKTLQIDPLRMYINGEQKYAYRLYETIATSLQQIVIYALTPDRQRMGPPCVLDPSALKWVGFDDDKAMLEASPNTHPGHRLLQEYFSFPEKFMFFDILGVEVSQGSDCFEILLISSESFDSASELPTPLLMLNCVPVINLFETRIEPLALDQMQYEYRLQGDAQNHRYCEIYSIKELSSIRQGESPRAISPYFSMDDFQHLAQQDYFYLTRRDESQLKDVRGTEIYLSFLDTQFKLTQPVDETLAGTAVCTNRGLPEQLRIGDALKLEGAGPVSAITIVSRPTWHQTPSLIGARPWALASTLALNHLSLAEGAQALAALKDILRLHAGSRNIYGFKQIDGVRGMNCKRVLRRFGRDAWRGFVPTLQIHLEFDRDNFSEQSVVLFGDVLRRFFALYCSVNMAVEVQIASNDRKGDLKQWSPLVAHQENLGGDTVWNSQAGAQPVL